MRMTSPTGGIVEFLSLDEPDNARGKTAFGVIIDEAGFVPERAWYEVLRPMISDTNGWVLAMGTPRGRNWFWRESLAARDQDDSAAWQVPTLGVAIQDDRLVRQIHPLENPHFPFREAVRMYESMPQRTFKQEFLAQFVEDAGLVFRGVTAVSTAQPGAPDPTHSYVMGIDWARSYDWTVLSVIDATTKTQVAVDRFNQIDYQFQLGRLEVMQERWHCESIIAEANAMGMPLVEQIMRRGLPVTAFTTTAQSKAEIIEGLALAIERRDVTLLDDATQRLELEAYDMQRLPGGTFRYGAPEGLHDDTVMALALAWHGVGSSGPLVIEI
jgi:hypothetical protein